MQSRELADKIARLVWEKKAEEILIMDLRQLTTMTDYFVICSVDSEVQARAVLEHVQASLRSGMIKPWHVEGTAGSSWLLLDFVDVVLHIFRPETRRFYSLERLWGDAEFIAFAGEKPQPG